MKRLLVVVFALTSLFSCNNNSDKTIVSSLDNKLNSSDVKYEYFISNGTWISTIDSLSEVDIVDDVWLFNYNGEKPESGYKYQIIEADLDIENSIIGGYLTLIKGFDTLKYGIDYISEKEMKLIYLPRGNFQSYIKKDAELGDEINQESIITQVSIDSNKLTFLEKYAGTSWTNGTDTIMFKNLKGEITDWSDVVGPEMWYLYSVDGPFFILPCEECYTGNECHMCGYNAIQFNDDTLELFWEYQNDFYENGEGVKFYSSKQNVISSIITRGGYFEYYESREINWFPLDADLSTRTDEISDNKVALDDFLYRKEVESKEIEKELFDDY